MKYCSMTYCSMTYCSIDCSMKYCSINLPSTFRSKNCFQCFPNYFPNKSFRSKQNLSFQSTFNVSFPIPSKCFSKGLKEKVAVSLLRRTKNDWTSETSETRAYLLRNQISEGSNCCEELLQCLVVCCESLLRCITVCYEACCESMLRDCMVQ